MSSSSRANMDALYSQMLNQAGPKIKSRGSVCNVLTDILIANIPASTGRLITASA